MYCTSMWPNFAVGLTSASWSDASGGRQVKIFWAVPILQNTIVRHVTAAILTVIVYILWSREIVLILLVQKKKSLV